MRRRIYYRAFLKRGDWEYPRYELFSDLIDPDDDEKVHMEIQIEHMKNRLVGCWRMSIPFKIDWKLGGIEFLNYSI